MIARYPGQTWIVRALLQDALVRHDSLRVESCWRQLAAINPDDVDAAARGAQVSLLRGSRVESASALLQRLHTAHPADAVITTARAFDLYRGGRFGDALALMGGLSPEELAAPERAPYLGALLAVAGPPDQARTSLEAALSRADLLPEENALVEGSRRLLEYRAEMAALLHGSPSSQSVEPGEFLDRAPSPNGSSAIFQVGESVALSRAGRPADAARVLSGIDPATLDPPALSIYLGGVLDLAGQGETALPYLELSPDLPFETPAQKFHRAVESWWKLQARLPNDPIPMAGLLAAYRGLDRDENDAAFWRGDEAREINFVRHALLNGLEIDEIQARLHGLLRRIPPTPEIQAECAYALLRQGQAGAARDRMEVLAPADLARPQSALYYGVILAACGEKQEARVYLRIAQKSALLPEETALIAQTGITP
jgi:tetratricopeptide (TPR) repeat protein